MMGKQLSIAAAAAILAACAGGLYYYWAYVMPSPTPPAAEAPAAAAPDNTVAAGPVISVSASSITIRKQDGSTATFAIDAATEALKTAEGRPGDPVAISDIKAGAMVLVTPRADNAAAAQTIVVLH